MCKGFGWLRSCVRDAEALCAKNREMELGLALKEKVLRTLALNV